MILILESIGFVVSDNAMNCIADTGSEILVEFGENHNFETVEIIHKQLKQQQLATVYDRPVTHRFGLISAGIYYIGCSFTTVEYTLGSDSQFRSARISYDVALIENNSPHVINLFDLMISRSSPLVSE